MTDSIADPKDIALPTKAYTVIRVHYFDPDWDSELMLGADGQWWTPGATSPTRAETLPLYITSFEVISKPSDPDYFDAEDPISARVRRDTVEEIAAWFALEAETSDSNDWRARAARVIRREFGVGA